MKSSYLFMWITVSIIVSVTNQGWSSGDPALLLEVKEAPKHGGDDAKGRAHFLSGKTITVQDLGAIQTIYMGLADGIWQRHAGSSGVLSFGKKGGGYPHITFGKDCINGVVAVHYSFSPDSRIQFTYDLITGTGPTHQRDEGVIPPGQSSVAQGKVATFMEKFRGKVNTLLSAKR